MNDPDRPLANEPDDRRYPAVLLDITSRCNLRCRHCFYFRDPRAEVKDVPTEEYLERVDALTRRHGFGLALWEGGEPMLRPELLARGVERFGHNIIPTNGTLEIPRLPNSVIVVSVDGPPEVNDYMRGAGAFERTIKTMARAKAETDNHLHFQATVCKFNQDRLGDLVEELMRRDVGRLLFTFYVPVKGEVDGELAWATNPERDRAVEIVLELKRRYPDFILNRADETEFALSQNCDRFTKNCVLKAFVLPLRANLDERMFCCYGENPDCHRCGSWGVFHNFLGGFQKD